MRYNGVFIFIGLLSVGICEEKWDFLVFSQRWLITACVNWREQGENNTCILRDALNTWTVHGIWPTKIRSEGPWNCNNSWHFDDNIINPIKLALEDNWANIEANTPVDSFWKHEWIKHGTCAALLPSLKNELKYFSQGLQWIEKYNVRSFFSRKNILPGPQGYPMKQIYEAVESGFQKVPIVQCIVDKYTKASLISEVRICFDKDLKLIDCRPSKYLSDYGVVDGMLTNCNVKKPVVYPNSVIPYSASKAVYMRPTTGSFLNALYETREKLLNFYKSVKAIIWFTF